MHIIRPVPSGGCVNETFLLISQVNRFICQQSWFLKYPSGADCWIHVGEEPGYDKKFTNVYVSLLNVIFQDVSLRLESNKINSKTIKNQVLQIKMNTVYSC